MEPIQMPAPPKSLIRQQWIRKIALFLLGVAASIGTVTGALAFRAIDDFQSESHCRSSLVNETSRLEGEISARGWKAVLDLRVKPSKAETEKRAKELTSLVQQWDVAQDRRNRANEICE